MPSKYLLWNGNVIPSSTESAANWQVLAKNIYFSQCHALSVGRPFQWPITGIWSLSTQVRTILTCHPNAMNLRGVNWSLYWDCIGSASPYVQLCSFPSLPRMLSKSTAPSMSFTGSYHVYPASWELNLNVLATGMIEKQILELKRWLPWQQLEFLSLEVDEAQIVPDKR